MWPPEACARAWRQVCHHPPVHLPDLILLLLSLLFLFLCSSNGVGGDPITIVLSQPAATNSTGVVANQNQTDEIPQGNNSNNNQSLQASNTTTPANTPTPTPTLQPAKPPKLLQPTLIPALRAFPARATPPRQEFYLQDKRGGATATAATARHVLEAPLAPPHGHDSYGGSGSGLVDNVSVISTTDEYGDQFLIRVDEEGGATYRVRKLPVVNSGFQFGLLLCILLVSVVANGVVILNVSRDPLKLKMIHFLLIRHVCITDFLGALFILPLPMVAIIRGEWTEAATSNRICAVVSTTTALFWTMHLISVALYRTDRVLAVWLPSGRYPICSVRMVHLLLASIWLTAIGGSSLATFTFGFTFQPALALCIPDVPIIFFIVVFTGYCAGLIALSTGYILAFARKRKRKRRSRKQALQAQMMAAVGAAQRALLSATTGGGGGGGLSSRSGSKPLVLTLGMGGSHVQSNHVVALGAGAPDAKDLADLEEQLEEVEEKLQRVSGRGGLDLDLERCKEEDAAFRVLENHSGDAETAEGGVSGGPGPVRVLQHQCTGFSDDFVPGGAAPPHQLEVPAGGYGGNVNALPSCTVTPVILRPSPLHPNIPPEPADDASSAAEDEELAADTDAADAAAATPTAGPPPPPPEPIVKCPHHFLEEGYQVLLSSSSEPLSSSSPSTSGSESSDSESCMLPAQPLPAAVGESEEAPLKKKPHTRPHVPSVSLPRRRRLTLTRQSFSLNFNPRVKSAGAAGTEGVSPSGVGGSGRRRTGPRPPLHSKSFDCYYDLLHNDEEEADAAAVRENSHDSSRKRPNSAHVALGHVEEPSIDVDAVELQLDASNCHFDLQRADELETALVPESHQQQQQLSVSRTGSRASRRSKASYTKIAVDVQEEKPQIPGNLNGGSECCRSGCSYGSEDAEAGGGVGGGIWCSMEDEGNNGTYSNSLFTQDGEDDENGSSHSHYIEVIHDQIDHFRFHEQRHSSCHKHSVSTINNPNLLAPTVVPALQEKGKGKRHRHHHSRGQHHHHQHNAGHRHKHVRKSSEAKKRALLSYALSVGHLLLYLPAMFVVGLQGASLPAGAALFCGIVVYCEFLIQPAALMILSHRLRTEITRMITRRPATIVNAGTKGSTTTAAVEASSVSIPKEKTDRNRLV